jgi:LmbE family N-acetylglucosaminyl deacetylase
VLDRYGTPTAYTVVILTLSSGAIGGEVQLRRHEALAAAGIIGARLYLHDFEDTRLDPAGGLITTIEELIREVEPTVVYTHSEHDRHQDHRAVRQAVDVAARRVPSLACFQSPSSTIDFRPTRFVPVDGFLDAKLQMLAAFESQSHRDYMDPDLVRATARYWSRFGGGGEYAEPLEMVRAAATISNKARAVGVTAAPETADEHGGHA